MEDGDGRDGIEERAAPSASGAVASIALCVMVLAGMAFGRESAEAAAGLLLAIGATAWAAWDEGMGWRPWE